MLELQRGDALPRVVLLQRLLNRNNGAGLTVDGRLGGLTLAAAENYKTTLQASTDPPGLFGTRAWSNLARNADFCIVDVIDIGDPGVMMPIANAMKSAGGDPILLGQMCAGVDQMVAEILRRSADKPIGLLRIIGHGNLGRWFTVSVGDVVDASAEDQAMMARETHSYIAWSNYRDLLPLLDQLTPRFAPFGSMEHGGCSLGSKPQTQQMMQALATTWRVPVSAGRGIQRSVFHFDGPTFSAFPRHGTLRSWTQGLPPS